MRGFLAGATLVGLVWAGYEWVRNPHGHRGGNLPPAFGFTEDRPDWLDQVKGVATPRPGFDCLPSPIYWYGSRGSRPQSGPRRHPLP